MATVLQPIMIPLNYADFVNRVALNDTTEKINPIKAGRGALAE